MMKNEQLDALRVKLAALGRQYTPADVAVAMRQLELLVSDATVLETIEILKRNSIGAGPLEELLHKHGVSDVLVNGPSQVYLDQGNGLEEVDIKFVDDEQVRQLATRLALAAGRRLDDACPFVDARLKNGARVHAVLSPIADPGTCISLRVPADRSFMLADLVSAKSISDEGAELLKAIIEKKIAFLISGGTGSGKTTLLGALLSEVAENQRILIVEDSRELNPDHPHVVRLESRQPNSEGSGTITLTDLVRQALRMRPDRLVVGEVRGGEICDLLRALNTGHEGGCGTVHANSVEDVPARLEALAALGGMERHACHSQIAAALDAVIHIKKVAGKREISEIGVTHTAENGIVHIEKAVDLRGERVVWLSAGNALREIVQ